MDIKFKQIAVDDIAIETKAEYRKLKAEINERMKEITNNFFKNKGFKFCVNDKVNITLSNGEIKTGYVAYIGISTGFLKIFIKEDINSFIPKYSVNPSQINQEHNE